MSASENSLSNPGLSIARRLEEQIKSADVDVPMLPEVANKVIILSQDPDSDALQLAKLIQGDQSLAGHVMRISNSAAYSPNATLISLQQAIARLGITLISDIALAASVNTKMFNTPGFEQHVDTVWKHALATALWSKEVARACRRNVEATFLCGLLHSIGRPVVLHAANEIAAELGDSLSIADGLILDTLYQQQIGLTVVEKWNMPKIVCESIRFFHDYENAPHAREQTTIVNCGARIANYVLALEQISEEQLLSLPVFSNLNLYQDDILEILNKKDTINSAMESMTL